MTMTQNVGKRVGRTYYQEIALLRPRNGAQLLNTHNSSSNIAAGAMVGPGAQFGGFGAFKSGFWRTGMASVTNPGGNWRFNVSGRVGLQLGNGDYAWIRLRFDDLGLNQPQSTLRGGATLQDGVDFPDGMTVVDWAYDDSGAAIAAGDQGALAHVVDLHRHRQAPLQTRHLRLFRADPGRRRRAAGVAALTHHQGHLEHTQ